MLEALCPKQRKYLCLGLRGTGNEQPATGLRVGEYGLLPGAATVEQLDTATVPGPVARAGAGHQAGQCQLTHAGQHRHLGIRNAGRQSGAACELQRMPQQAEAGDVGHGMYPVQPTQGDARGIEPGRRGDHRLVIRLRQPTLLHRRRIDPHPEPLAEDEDIAGPTGAVRLDPAWVDDADRHQTVNRFPGIDGMPPGDRDTRLTGHRLATGEYPPDGVVRQAVDRHPDQGKRKQRAPAHRVDVGDRVCRGDPPKFVRVVDDRHEKISGRNDRLALVQPPYRGIVRGLDTHQQIGEVPGQPFGEGRIRQNLLEHRRRDFATAATAG